MSTINVVHPTSVTFLADLVVRYETDECCVPVCPVGPAVCSNDESRLVKTLFTGYNKVVRPVNHFSEAVEVTVGLQLIQLISVVRARL